MLFNVLIRKLQIGDKNLWLCNKYMVQIMLIMNNILDLKRFMVQIKRNVNGEIVWDVDCRFLGIFINQRLR